MPTLAEMDAVISVLWYTHAIRSFYEDRASSEDERFWKNNGGMFANYARYNSQKWKDTMGPDDPTVRGRRISQSSMIQARRQFVESYREPVMFALELLERVRAAVDKSVEKHGESEYGEREEEVAAKALAKIASDPAVRKKLAELGQDCCNVDASSVDVRITRDPSV